MKTVTLTSLKLTNFKGIKSLEVNFSKETTISGANATGKTTVQDAFMWLLFGKNSTDAKDFNIKNTVDTSMNRADHEVVGVFDVDGVINTLKRVYREKWTKKRGEESTEFTAHETLYFWNDVPMQQKEYQEKIVEVFTTESNLKLISNPLYFNTQIKWTDRRNMLITLAGQISNDQITGTDDDLKGLLMVMQRESKSIEDLSKEYASKKKLLKKDLEIIPSRIDEVKRMQPDGELDLNEANALVDEHASLQATISTSKQAFEAQQAVILEKKQKMAEIETLILNRTAVIRKAYNETVQEVELEAMNLLNKSQLLLNEKTNLISRVDSIHKHNEQLQHDLAALREQYSKVASEKFVLNGDLKCPTCHQEYADAAERLPVLQENFNTNKVKRIQMINVSGSDLKTTLEKKNAAELEAITIRINEIKSELMKINGRIGEIETLKTARVDIQTLINSDKQVKAYNNELKVLEQNIVSIPDDKATAELEKRATDIKQQLYVHQTAIEYRTKQQDRIAELTAEEKRLSKQLAELEKFEFLISRFSANKINLVEKAINNKFDAGVTFQMFDKQVNGAAPEMCETLIWGVPFSDANHAGQINAGVAICNTFSAHLGITAPIFIDNCEAVNSLHTTPSQIIKLFVTNDKTLTIN